MTIPPGFIRILDVLHVVTFKLIVDILVKLIK